MKFINLNIKEVNILMTYKNVYWTITHFEEKTFLFAATNNGLCYVDCHNEPLLVFKKWCQKNLPTFTLIEDMMQLNRYITELKQYFSGEKETFTSPLDLYGTEFQLIVWKSLQTITYGNVISYSDIAKEINKPTAVRAVATAIGANPILIFIPCHRVIGKDGSLTGFRAGLNVKKQLLVHEKVAI